MDGGRRRLRGTGGGRTPGCPLRSLSPSRARGIGSSTVAPPDRDLGVCCMRIVRLANFVTTHSGGLRTALRNLGEGYQRAGHEAVLIVPGRERSDRMTSQGRVITLPSAPLPRTGGYRVMAGRRELDPAARLARTGPDRGLRPGHAALDRPLGPAARRRLDDGLAREPGRAARRVGHAETGLAGRPAQPAYRRDVRPIVCTTAFAAAEFRRLGVPNLVEVPLGVDLEEFHPSRADAAVRGPLRPPGRAAGGVLQPAVRGQAAGAGGGRGRRAAQRQGARRCW